MQTFRNVGPQPSVRRVVLIVDPDPDTRALYRMPFDAADWEVIEAEDGRDALARGLPRRPALVVTDARLPFINGFDVCRIFRRDAATSEAVIILLSADGSAARLSQAQASGASLLVDKPCSAETVFAAGLRLSDPTRTLTLVSSAPSPATRRGDGSPRPGLTKVKNHQRFVTKEPPAAPPSLVCPTCDQPLDYEESQVGGVSDVHAEQWDYFKCVKCGRFQYRQRTRKLRACVVGE
jgi:CheY-like chemotaxis protein